VIIVTRSPWLVYAPPMHLRSAFGLLAVALAAVACGDSAAVTDKAATVAPTSHKEMAIAAGYLHTCAVTRAGGVRCWGSNDSGQLGNGTTRDSSVPVGVVGLTRGVVALAAGGHHTCALTSAGGVKCWGLNDGGQLGNGTTDDSSTPVDVRGLASRVIAITAGAGWVCALTRAGGVKCWGWNAYGQLGNRGGDGSINVQRPVGVSGLASGVIAISASALHICALTSAGHVKCWGSISAPKTDSNVPIEIAGLGSDATAITAGGLHACAITGRGAVECWGYNGEGELGNGGSKTYSGSPVEVATLTKGMAALAAGSTYDFLPSHTCVLTRAGGARCWGPNGDGQLGNGTTTDSSRPVDVSGLTSGLSALSVGGSHTCAITKAKQLKCWGDNSNGQLGNGSLTNSPTPVDIVGF
jgi:alpha-tubulin suppressor-like RCC1 family protein